MEPDEIRDEKNLIVCSECMFYSNIIPRVNLTITENYDKKTEDQNLRICFHESNLEENITPVEKIIHIKEKVNELNKDNNCKKFRPKSDRESGKIRIESKDTFPYYQLTIPKPPPKLTVGDKIKRFFSNILPDGGY